ncbi:MAG: hypothetical protein GXP27_22845 [Planctomycetes bacterium]|nr:hypothetical protein [Planctomycetota bacterium]
MVFAELNELLSLFAGERPLLARVSMVAPTEVPQPYRELLVHDEHMTEAMETFYQGPVAVRVLEEHHHGNDYGRKIVLTKAGSEQVVQFGIVKMNLSRLGDSVRRRILARRTPLGRILAESETLRHIHLEAVLRVMCGPELAECLQTRPLATTYGRLAMIRCDGRPAVKVLEICAPVPSEDGSTER